MKIDVLVTIFLWLFRLSSGESEEYDPENPHRNPSKCEVCKIVSEELQLAMEDSGKTHEVITQGGFDRPQKRIKYTQSEIRLIEVLESVCDRVLKYNIHAERKSSRRFAKGRSETMQTLQDLVHKGVKVDLGIPYSMWDEPSAAVTKANQYCHHLIENYEDAIENWFFKTDQSRELSEYLCVDRVLTKEEAVCLTEVWTGKERVHGTEDEDDEEEEENNSKLKGDPGSKDSKDEL